MLRTLYYYIKLIKSFWCTSLSIEMEYKLNLYIEFISVIGNLLGSIFLLKIFYSKGATLSDWTFDASLIILGFYTLLDAFATTFLQPNLSRIVRHVQLGTLDFVLLKPLDSQVWISFRMISPWGLPSFLSGFILIIYGIYNSRINITLESFSSAFLMSLSSIFILYSIWFLLSASSIWFVKVWNSTEVLRSLLMAGKYPVSSYPQAIRFVFTFFLPIAFMTTVPAEVILHKSDSFSISTSLFISFALFIFSRYFWKFGLSFYTSASS